MSKSLGFTSSLPLVNASVLQRLKEGYLLWVSVLSHIPKSSRYTLGTRIENKFLDLFEQIYTAYFSEKENKPEKIAECILILDTLKYLISLTWEAKLISHKQCENIALKLDEVGKMLGGWRKNLVNKDSKNPA